MSSINRIGFNTQPPEGGWLSGWGTAAYFAYVSTHSRPKAAGYVDELFQDLPEVSTHSRPKAAASVLQVQLRYHSRFNTQPPEGGWQCVT